MQSPFETHRRGSRPETRKPDLQALRDRAKDLPTAETVRVQTAELAASIQLIGTLATALAANKE